MEIAVGNGQVYYPATSNPDGSINPGVITTPSAPPPNLPEGVTMPPLADSTSLQSPNVCTLANPQGISPDTTQVSNPDPYASTEDPNKKGKGCPTCAVKQKVSGGIFYGNATTNATGTTLGGGLQTPGAPAFSNQICSTPVSVGSNYGPTATLSGSVAGYSTTGSLGLTGASVQVCSPIYGTPTSWTPSAAVGVGNIPLP